MGVGHSDAAPEQIDMLLASALKDGRIKWASLVKVPESISDNAQSVAQMQATGNC